MDGKNAGTMQISVIKEREAKVHAGEEMNLHFAKGYECVLWNPKGEGILGALAYLLVCLRWKGPFAQVTLSRALRVAEEGGSCELGGRARLVSGGRVTFPSSSRFSLCSFLSLSLLHCPMAPIGGAAFVLLGRRVKGKIRECLHLSLPWKAREGRNDE